jgi:hypothetical protein
LNTAYVRERKFFTKSKNLVILIEDKTNHNLSQINTL